MASNNPYEEDVDFSALALQYPDFNKYLKPNGQLDFSNPDAVQQLTKSLLQRDFGLQLDLPDDRLCPPVPNRLNYILWLQKLIDSTGPGYSGTYNPERQVTGLDIGTGASCIYPLLGCTQRAKWRFIATDVDEKSLDYAKRNILANQLQNRIRPVSMKPEEPLIPLDTLDIDSVDFTMCNPPFYSSTGDLLASASSKSRPPYSACTGAPVEMVTPGGEVAFVKRMIEESQILKQRVQWYTTMLGKHSSIGLVMDQLKERGVNNWAVTEFVQGQKTRRWGVAWSWGGMRPSMNIARALDSLSKSQLPFPSTYHIAVPDTMKDGLFPKVNGIIQALDIEWQFRPAISTGIGMATRNVWSRAARRSNKIPAGSSQGDMHYATDDEGPPALVFKIQIAPQSDSEAGGLDITWLEGLDSVLFESFCGMLKRKVNAK